MWRMCDEGVRSYLVRIPVNVTGNSGERDRWVGVARFYASIL